VKTAILVNSKVLDLCRWTMSSGAPERWVVNASPVIPLARPLRGAGADVSNQLIAPAIALAGEP